MIKRCFFFVLLLCSSNLFAEYRVYQYYITSKLEGKKRLMTSTLDPKSFVAYHGGEQSISVDLLRSWPCWGYTGGGLPLCPPPWQLDSALIE